MKGGIRGKSRAAAAFGSKAKWAIGRDAGGLRVDRVWREGKGVMSQCGGNELVIHSEEQ